MHMNSATGVKGIRSPYSKSPERKRVKTREMGDENSSIASNMDDETIVEAEVVTFTPKRMLRTGKLREVLESASEDTTPELSAKELELKRSTLKALREDETLSFDELQRLTTSADDSDDENEFRDTKDDSDEDSDNDGLSRRNTASPSALQMFLEDISDDDDEEMQAAIRRGKKQCEDIQSLPSTGRRSTRSATRQKSSETPLKSCLSAKKPNGKSTNGKKKTVAFGSPNAAEFDRTNPVKGGVTPLTKTYARERFKMQELLIEEDADTAANTSILATWEEESEPSRNSRGSSGKKSSSQASKRKSRRTSSSGFEKPDIGPDLDLNEQFDAMSNGDVSISSPPTPNTAEMQVQAGHGIPLMKIANSSKSTESDEDCTVELGTIGQLAALSPASNAMSPSPLKHCDTTDDTEDQTVEVGSLKQLAALSPGSPQATNAKRQSIESIRSDEEDEHTVELGSLRQLSQLTPESTSKKKKSNTPRQRTAPESPMDDSTVDLGTLKQLATLSPQSPTVSTPGLNDTLSPSNLKDLGIFSPSTPLDDEQDTDMKTPEEIERRVTRSSSAASKSKGRDTGKKIRLSFMSESSAETKTTPHAKFDSKKMLEQFMDSPMSIDSPSINSLQEMKAVTEKANADFVPCSPQIDEEEEEEEVILPEEPTGRSSAEQTSPEQNVDASCFVARKSLARTPIKSAFASFGDHNIQTPVDEEEDAEEEISRELQSPQAPTTTKTLAEVPSLDEVLALCSLEYPQQCKYIEEPEESFTASEEINTEPCDLVPEIFSRILIKQASLYGLKLACNEIRSRILDTQTSIDELSDKASHSTLLHEFAVDRDNTLDLLIILRDRSQIEAQAICNAFQSRCLELSIEAMNEERESILLEDLKVLQEGVVRLRNALTHVSESVSKARKAQKLLCELREQELVASQYENEIETVKNDYNTRKSDLITLDADLNKQLEIEQQYQAKLVQESNMGELKSREQTTKHLGDILVSLFSWRLVDMSGSHLRLEWTSCELVQLSVTIQIQNGNAYAGSAQVRTTQQTAFAEALSKVALQRAKYCLSSISGDKKQTIGNVLLNLDVEFGRLHDLFQEFRQVSHAAEIPCNLTMNGQNIRFSSTFLLAHIESLVNATFNITPGYPTTANCCTVEYTIKSNRDTSTLRNDIDQKICIETSPYDLEPFSTTWNAINQILK